jgi:hypothetical protein
LSSIMSTRMTVARSVIWSVMPSSFSTGRLYAVSLNSRRQVVHPGHERGALDPVAELEVLLDAGVQVSRRRAGTR